MKARIIVEHSRDSFGLDGDAAEGVDVEASIDNFSAILANDIARTFPGADVSVDCTINDKVDVIAGSWEEEEGIAFTVREMIGTLFEDWERWGELAA